MTEKFDGFGDRVALVDSKTGVELTFAAISSAVRRLARSLGDLGFKKGDVLCIFSPNVVEYPIVFYAVASLGGILQAASPLYTSGELETSLNMCGSRFLVTVPPLLTTFRKIEKHSVEKVIVFGEEESCISFSTLITSNISDEPISDQDINPKEDVVAILFSSGTTGKPKGVQLTHYAIVANILQMIEQGNLTETDCFATFLPFFHIYGLVPIMSTVLYLGARNIIMPKFDLQDYLTIIQKYKITSLLLVPPVMVLLSRHPILDQFDLNSVTQIGCGAAPLSKEIEAKVIGIFKNVDYIAQGFGMTECLVTHFTSAAKNKFGSVGVLLAGTECKIVDLETGQTLPADKDGEVCVRGPSLMKGYLGNQEATDAMIDKDGWLKTGDIGHLDEEGFLFLVDRLKELIKYKGFQVAPAELEDILLGHPDVVDVGVIGIPDEEAGELPKAFIVKKHGSDVTEQSVQEYVESKVSTTKKLRGGVCFIKEIPKSASGKILRRVLREMEKNTIRL